MATINDLYQAVENKSAKVLTIDLANELKGRKIATLYFGYKEQDGFNEFIIGDIVSHYDMAKQEILFNEVDPRFANRAEYWESYMTKEQLDYYQNKLMILTNEGRQTRINCYAYEGAFWCSDSDRFVYFIEVTDEN